MNVVRLQLFPVNTHSYEVILDILQLYISIYSVMFVVDLTAGADVDDTATETHRRCNPLREEAQAIPEGHEWWER